MADENKSKDVLVHADHVKVYFKGNVLNVTKPTRLSTKRMLEILKVEEQNLYDKYKKIV